EPIELLRLGLMPYPRALTLMEQRAEQRWRGEVADALLLVEHPAVFTVGRSRAGREQLLDPGDIPVFLVNRGGGATYHGPGQVVLYPVVRLRPPAPFAVDLLRLLERAVIAVLARYGITAEVRPGATGVWTGERKIASIGVASAHEVTTHGVALNVRPVL